MDLVSGRLIIIYSIRAYDRSNLWTLLPDIQIMWVTLDYYYSLNYNSLCGLNDRPRAYIGLFYT